MDVLFDAATIELKRLETYACERMSDVLLARPDFAFHASAFMPL